MEGYLESLKQEMKLKKPPNGSLNLVNNVKLMYDLKKGYDLLLGKNNDQEKIKLE